LARLLLVVPTAWENPKKYLKFDNLGTIFQTRFGWGCKFEFYYNPLLDELESLNLALLLFVVPIARGNHTLGSARFFKFLVYFNGSLAVFAYNYRIK
jgi:hypothetical protein